MKQRKSWMALLAATTMLAVTACGGNGNHEAGGSAPASSAPASSAPASAQASEAATPEPPAPVEITIWDKPAADDPLKTVREETFSDFQAKYPYITVKHETAPTGTNDRQAFMTAMAGGNGPDAYSQAYFPIIRDWIKAGYALDLSKYWEGFADKDKFIASAMQQGTVDGKVYGVPNNMYVTGLYYNKRFFEAAGLDPNAPPADWNQFVEYAKKLTDPAKKQYGYALLGMEWADWFFEYYVWQAGGDLTTVNDDGTVTLNFTKEPTVKALEYWRDLKWKHKVVQSNVTQNFDDNLNDFFQKRAAMMLGASDWFGNFAKNGMDLNDVGFAPLPAGPSGTAPSQAGGADWIINPKTSKEKQDAAWLYVSYMTSKEVYDKINHYNFDNGIMPNLLSVRSDVNPVEGAQNVPQDLIAGVQKTAENVHMEYALKERLSPYIVKAIQKVLLTENAEVKKELQTAEESAQREMIDPYNAEVAHRLIFPSG